MFGHSLRYIKKEKEETINLDEHSFKKLEDLSMKKTTNVNNLAGNVKAHCDSSNLRFQRGIKEC